MGLPGAGPAEKKPADKRRVRKISQHDENRRQKRQRQDYALIVSILTIFTGARSQRPGQGPDKPRRRAGGAEEVAIAKGQNFNTRC